MAIFSVVFSLEILMLLSLIVLSLCIQETPKRVFFANSEDLDEIQHNAAFHQGLHCL